MSFNGMLMAGLYNFSYGVTRYMENCSNGTLTVSFEKGTVK